MEVVLTDRIGELFLTAYQGAWPSQEFMSFARRRRVGGVILFADNCPDHQRLSEALALIHKQQEAGALVAIDQEGGRVCRLKGAPAEYRAAGAYAKMAGGGESAKDEALAAYAGEFSAAARYMAELGINLLLGPVCDLALWRGDTALEGRTFGASPHPAAEFVTETVRLCHQAGLTCCLKHAPGLGRVCVDPHRTLGESPMTLEEFRTVDSVPFRAGISAGADSLMTSHFVAREFDDSPVTFSKTTVEILVREALSENLALLSDDLSMGALAEFGSPGKIACRALAAGHDLLLTRDHRAAEAGISAIEAALESGAIPRQRILQALGNVERLKERALGVDQRGNPQ
ncbi:MAG: glycoside hydrolase family 3 N-terminal domain-containing protein [Candidatus Zixiibacteriota bacterium]